MTSKVGPPQLGAVIHSRTALYEGFLRLYRYESDTEKHAGGIRRTSWEMMERGNAVNLVAASINKNESALDAAVREMREETGLDLGSPTLIHPGAYVSSAKVFIDRVRNGDITDLKTLVAGYWFAERQAAR
jgi:8-oxo-dGTP pyrophosphatase MutT (NUDIX family)